MKPALFSSSFNFQSQTAAWMASSASMLQWSFTGGSLRWLAMSVFFIPSTSLTVFPLIHSVATLPPSLGLVRLSSILSCALVLGSPAARNRWATTKRLELRINYYPALLVNLNLQLHDISTSRSPNEPSPHIIRFLVQRSNISRILVVLYDVVVVKPGLRLSWRAGIDKTCQKGDKKCQKNKIWEGFDLRLQTTNG